MFSPQATHAERGVRTQLLAKAEKEQDNATKEIERLISQHEDFLYLIVQIKLQDSERNIKTAKDFLNKAKDKAAYLTTIDCELWCGDLYEYPYESALQVLQDIRSAVDALLKAERNLQEVLAIIAENDSLDWGKLESYSHEARIWIMTSKLVAERTEKMLEKELRLLEPGFLCQDQGKDGTQ